MSYKNGLCHLSPLKIEVFMRFRESGVIFVTQFFLRYRSCYIYHTSSTFCHLLMMICHAIGFFCLKKLIYIKTKTFINLKKITIKVKTLKI